MPRTGKDYVVFGVSKTKSLDRRKTKNESLPDTISGQGRTATITLKLRFLFSEGYYGKS